MNLNQILPQVYVGSCPMNDADIQRLQGEFAITAVLSVQTEDDLAYWGINWEELEADYRRQGIAVRRVPIRDFDPEDLRRNLRAGVQALDELVRRGHTVYLHCSAGINRSPSTLIAYLHWIEGRNLDDALAHVIARRSCDPYMQAVRLAVEDELQRQAARRGEL